MRARPAAAVAEYAPARPPAALSGTAHALPPMPAVHEVELGGGQGLARHGAVRQRELLRRAPGGENLLLAAGHRLAEAGARRGYPRRGHDSQGAVHAARRAVSIRLAAAGLGLDDHD